MFLFFSTWPNKTFDWCYFAFVTPYAWNKLAQTTRSQVTIFSFKCHPEMYFFRLDCPSLSCLDFLLESFP